jgi:hypothetical protein
MTATSAFADGGAGSTLLENDVLFAGQRLVSDSCYYHLEMQTDGNLVEYAGAGSGPNQAVWSNGKAGNGPTTYVVLQDDSNFVEYDDYAGSYHPLWASNTAGDGNQVLWLQNDGNVVLYPANHAGQWATWWTGTHGNVPGLSPCPMQTRFTQMLFSMNLPGDDFDKLCTNDANQCGLWCAGDPDECMAWTWTPGGDPGACSATVGACWLKSSVPQSSSYFYGMTSGIIHVFTP